MRTADLADVVVAFCGLAERPNMVARFRCGCVRGLPAIDREHMRAQVARVECGQCHFDRKERESGGRRAS